MTTLGGYADLANETQPKTLIEALKLYGVTEIKGSKHNPVIMDWALELGPPTPALYLSDETPWCGLFAGIVVKRAGFEPPRLLVRARAWLEFGSEVTAPALMDLLVFERGSKHGAQGAPGGAGHVGFYVGHDDDAYHVLGGNQGDQVKIARIERERLIGARRPLYEETPQTIRGIARAAQGELAIALA